MREDLVTPEEVRSAIRLHADRDPLLREEDGATLADIAEALGISEPEAGELLAKVRESQASISAPAPIQAPAPPMILDFGERPVENPRSWEIMWAVLLGILALLLFVMITGERTPS